VGLSGRLKVSGRSKRTENYQVKTDARGRAQYLGEKSPGCAVGEILQEGMPLTPRKELGLFWVSGEDTGGKAFNVQKPMLRGDDLG